ncbi:MAG TPA: Asp-tRNA(Asn)/Glu-tRNA(Gln) amidotransferase subunit GatC [Elusimicrobiota bacterium]|jgi:aspartyl-tRNA(Asn)/glutamyl-tRNA(Gln) amidotransferase subunit C|nr:Asp-tRNA(Asn)/Glu-tRNA(Gln) amidotransferase subunit GatC [Elusimicrobiota bacterium]
MEITEEDVRRIARLARLTLSPEEIRTYRGQLVRILEHMEELKRLDTARVEPTAHALGLKNVLREDEARPYPDRAGLLAAAPAADGPYFKVPKVIE